MITAAFIITAAENKIAPDAVRVACVGDSLTQSSAYPFDLAMHLGAERYAVGNFGAGGTTISLNSETPYMNSSAFQRALKFQPNIVIIMLGTNDAQPSLLQYNASLSDNYKTLVATFQTLTSKPKIWIVLPPPIFDSQSGKIWPEYFGLTVIGSIEQAANQTGLPTIDVYSALATHPDYFPDGVHPNGAGAGLIANEIYKSLTLEEHIKG
jgi:acyl-CoA thioesterase I